MALAPLPFWGLSALAKSRTPGPTEAGATVAAVAAVAARLDVKDVDSKVDPCTDFYKYACGNWTAHNPIPADQPSWSHFGQLAEWNRQVLHDVLEMAARPRAGRSDNEKKIGDAYASCMDDKALDQKGTAPLAAELTAIDKLKSKADLPELVARIHQNDASAVGGNDSGARTALFGFGAGQDLDDASKVVAQADQGGLGLPDRDYYLKTDAKSVETRQKYQAHVQRMFTLLHEPPAKAAADAKTVLDIETALAKSAMDIVKRRDPKNLNHKLTLAQLSALTPSFSWDRYLKALHAPPSEHYLVATPDFYKGLEAELQTRPLSDWQTYLRWHVLHAAAPLLSNQIADENFDFYGKTLVGQKEQRPRWKRCVAIIDRDLGEALGQVYVERTFGADGKRRMLDLVHGLEKALGADIQHLDWMTPKTKQEALGKLKAFEEKIGYPDKWRDYGTVQIVRGDALGNAHRASVFEYQRQLKKIGKPVDRTEWNMTPPTVNAYYDPQLNTINFPAGILQPPFFDKSMDDPINYGAIGSVIGHEMTHGFDDQGRQFDKTGNLRDWWTQDDAKSFEGRAQCVADQYSGYTAAGDAKVNGKLTLGENTADNGGVRVALMALHDTLAAQGKTLAKDADGNTPDQRFFLAYAQLWCANYTPELLRMLVATNPHSPPQYRVNGVVSNMPEFQKAFSCKKGQAMAPEHSCRVW